MSKDFKPQDYFRYKKLGTRWQKPRGLQSKLRKSKKGAGILAGIGYRSPRKFRGLERGLEKAVVIKSLGGLDSVQENTAIILAASLGKKKAFEITEAAGQRKIKVLNRKSADAARSRAQEIAARKEKKKEAKKPEEKPAEKEKTEAVKK